jgi:hypothetical protein
LAFRITGYLSCHTLYMQCWEQEQNYQIIEQDKSKQFSSRKKSELLQEQMGIENKLVTNRIFKNKN